MAVAQTYSPPAPFFQKMFMFFSGLWQIVKKGQTEQENGPLEPHSRTYRK